MIKLLNNIIYKRKLKILHSHIKKYFKIKNQVSKTSNDFFKTLIQYAPNKNINSKNLKLEINDYTLKKRKELLKIKSKIDLLLNSVLEDILRESNPKLFEKKIQEIIKYEELTLLIIYYLKAIVKSTKKKLNLAYFQALFLFVQVDEFKYKEKRKTEKELFNDLIKARILENKIESYEEKLKNRIQLKIKLAETIALNINKHIKKISEINKSVSSKRVLIKEQELDKEIKRILSGITQKRTTEKTKIKKGILYKIIDLLKHRSKKNYNIVIDKDNRLIKDIEKNKIKAPIIVLEQQKKQQEIQQQETKLKEPINRKDLLLLNQELKKPVDLKSFNQDNQNIKYVLLTKPESEDVIYVKPQPVKPEESNIIDQIKPSNESYISLNIKNRPVIKEKPKLKIKIKQEPLKEEADINKRITLNTVDNTKLNQLITDEEEVLNLKKPVIKSKQETKAKEKINKRKINLFSKKNRRMLFSNKTKIPDYLKKIEFEISTETEPEIQQYKTEILKKETENIKRILKTKKAGRSKFANISDYLVKSLTLKLMNIFPSFFKTIYVNIKLSNLRVLGNTYANMMVFASLLTFITSFTLFSFLFYSLDFSLDMLIIKAFMISLLFTSSTVALFYLYPKSIINQHKKDIDTNLPFAITHMAALSNSGVTPLLIFQLIGNTRDYGEISKIFKRIVDLIDDYGYDLITATKTIMNIIPSDKMKEFLHGFIATIETGGSLDLFLEHQRTEALLDYKLERQKYVKTVSTYSDIYTGILVAAPLFFIITLSLVNMLGGKIMGLNIKTLIALGTYLLIPLLNISFIAFLRFTQPKM